MMENNFKLLMLSAMYENGGNTTHRLLDGHPELYVYPFESQPGTKYVLDHLSSLYPFKYRWPVFPSGISAFGAYKIIKDEEGKIRTRTPYVSKFRDTEFELSDDERCEIFQQYLEGKDVNTPNSMEAFFRATFDAWKNYNRSGEEKVYVGYSPIIGIDGNKIIESLDYDGFVLHVIRNPFSAYAETKKRPVPLSLDHYITGWIMCQQYAKLFENKYPDNFFILRYEDIIKNPKEVLGKVVEGLSLKTSDTLTYPSWNGEKLTEVYPWGTIRIPTKEVNIQTARELSKSEIDEIYQRTQLYIDLLEYNEIYREL